MELNYSIPLLFYRVSGTVILSLLAKITETMRLLIQITVPLSSLTQKTVILSSLLGIPELLSSLTKITECNHELPVPHNSESLTPSSAVITLRIVAELNFITVILRSRVNRVLFHRTSILCDFFNSN
jgi:hypothetical protein